MPLPIAMDAINAIIVRCQSAHKMSLSNATRKARAISLEATRQPCHRTQQEHCEGVVSITSILIPQQRLLPQGRQLLQWVHDGCKLQWFANQRRSHGSYAWRNDGNYPHHQHGQRERHKLGGCGNNKRDNKKSLPKREDKGFEPWCLHGKHANHLYDECCANPRHQVRELQQKVQTTTKSANNNKRNTAAMTHAPCVMRATISGQAVNWVAWQSQWHRPWWQKTSVSNYHKQITTIFLVIQKKEDACCLMLWPGHSNFNLSQKNWKQFWMASHDKDAHQHPRLE